MNKNEEKFIITPKGIFTLALYDTHLVEDIDDWRIDAAWKIFELTMKAQGFIKEEE